jgi:uncharacterized protein (TIGR01244 family)
MNNAPETPLAITPVNEHFAVAPQLLASQLAHVAALGFRAVINNRPDGEAGPDQPSNESLRAAALVAGLRYAYVPVPPTTASHEQVLQMQQALVQLPKPVLAFCRSGTRSKRLYETVRALDGSAA